MSETITSAAQEAERCAMVSEPTPALLGAILSVSWPDGGRDGFPNHKTAQMIAEKIARSPWLAAHDAEVAGAVRVLPSVERLQRFVFDDPDAGDGEEFVRLAEVLAALADAPSREQVERAAAEKALREAADEVDLMGEEPMSGAAVSAILKGRANWLRARAARLAAGGEA